MSQRGIFLKMRSEMKLSADTILGMTSQMRGKTDEEKRRAGDAFYLRIEEKQDGEKGTSYVDRYKGTGQKIQ